MVLKRASGFQSVQFRLLENKLGVLPENRIQYAKKDYKDQLQRPDHIAEVTKSEIDMSLFDLIEVISFSKKNSKIKRSLKIL